MRKAHANLIERGLDDSHFDAVVELLGDTLEDLGVGRETILGVAAVAESVRDDILGRDVAAA
jgi:hemoglobin